MNFSDNINQSGISEQFNERYEELNQKYKKTIEEKKGIEKQITDIKNQ